MNFDYTYVQLAHIYACMYIHNMVQLNLNSTYVCRYTSVLICLMCVKLQKLACTHSVACNFGMCTWNSKYMQHTRDARHQLALGFPHYTCGVTTGIAVGDEIQLFCS